MKYTKNIHNKLLLIGFVIEGRYKGTEDGPLDYTVYKKGLLEVTVCDSHKEVDVIITADEEGLSHLNLEQLNVLDEIINQHN